MTIIIFNIVYLLYNICKNILLRINNSKLVVNNYSLKKN